jgi:hypothetical protein
MIDWLFILLAFGVLIGSIILGGVLVLTIWYVYGKIKDKQIKKDLVISDIKKQIEATKPQLVERGQEQDGRTPTDKIRQFEKLRRNTATAEPVNSVLSGSTEIQRRNDLQNGLDNGNKQNHTDSRKPARIVKLD